jgi:hypothetical protein
VTAEEHGNVAGLPIYDEVVIGEREELGSSSRGLGEATALGHAHAKWASTLIAPGNLLESL